MASKFHKNAVLTGYVDFYCLVCESYIRSEEDADVHINKPIHKKNLGFAVYFEKFRDDHIWKVKKGYYCEFCNKFLSTTAKVGLHVVDSKHNDNKGTQCLKRVGNSIIMSNNTFINENAWNGVIGETCVLCNTEFYNESIHKTDQGHILNLILKNVEFLTESDIYRKIDESSFQCLTCNLIFSLDTLNTHFKDENHIKNYKACSQFTSPVSLENKTEEKKALNFKAASTVAKTVIKDKDSKAGTKVDSEIKCTDKAKSLKTEKTKAVVTPDTNKNYEANNAENENKTSKMKNNETKNTHKANSKAECEKDPCFCENDNSNYETEFNPLLKDAAISAVVKEMKKMWKKEDKPDAKKPRAKNSRVQEKAKILDSITEFQKKGINVNFENDTVFCKKCFENVDFSFEAIEKHIEDHKSKPTDQVKAEFTIEVNKNYSKTDIKNDKLDNNHNLANATAKNDEQETENNLDKALVSYVPPANVSKTDNKAAKGTKVEIPESSKTKAVKVTEEPKDPASYAKANHMTYNKGNNNAYCRICNSRVPANLKNMKEHVNGNVHRNKAAKVVTDKEIIPKKPMKKFITNRSTVANMYHDDVIVNDKFCITRLSYLMITEHGQRMRCQACEVNLTEEDIDRHLESCCHERAMEMTPVVWSLSKEFVREVRPGLFHCGFCNLIVGRWEDVASHLKCTDHLENKEYAAERLSENLPGILEYRRFKARQFLNAGMGMGFDIGGFFF